MVKNGDIIGKTDLCNEITFSKVAILAIFRFARYMIHVSLGELKFSPNSKFRINLFRGCKKSKFCPWNAILRPKFCFLRLKMHLWLFCQKIVIVFLLRLNLTNNNIDPFAAFLWPFDWNQSLKRLYRDTQKSL